MFHIYPSFQMDFMRHQSLKTGCVKYACFLKSGHIYNCIYVIHLSKAGSYIIISLKFFLVLAVSLRFNPTVYTINENAGFVQPTLTLSAPLTTDLTLQVTNIDSTATSKCNIKLLYLNHNKYHSVVEDNDYNAGPYSVMFVAGQTDASFDVTINDEDMLERDESFMLKIDESSLSLDTVTLDTNNDEATVTIMNDDSKLITYWL